MNSRTRLASNTFYNLINTIFAGVFGLATSVVVARGLGSDQLGEYSYMLWLIGILTLFINAGLPMAATKYIAEYHGRNETATAKSILISIIKIEAVITFATSSIVSLLSYLLVSDAHRQILLLLASINIIPIALSRIYYSAAAGIQKYQILVKASLITSPIQFIFIVLTLMSGYSVKGLILANICGSVLNLTILWYLVRNEFRDIIPSPTPIPKEKIFKYSVAVSAILLIDAIVWQKSEVFFLERFSTAKEIAFYSLAFTIGYMAMQIPAVFSSLLVPYFSEIYGRRNSTELERGYINSTRYLAIIAFPIGIGGALLSAPLIELVYGREYLNAVIPAQIILIFNSFGAVSRASSSILYGTEEQSFILKWGSIIAVLNILLDLILIPAYGSIGAAIANSSAQMGGVIGGAIYINKEFGIAYPLKSIFMTFISSVIMGIGIYIINIQFIGYAGLLLSFSVSPFIYIIVLWLLNAIDADDLTLIYKVIKR